MLASDTESDLDHFGRFKNNPNGFRVLELDTVHNENPVYTHWSLLINDISYESYSFYFALYVQAESYILFHRIKHVISYDSVLNNVVCMII